MVEGQVFRFGKKRFHKHMKQKDAYWKPISLFLGEDFAMFEFDFKYQMDNAFDGIKFWIDSYNYGATCDGDKRFVIINRSAEEGSAVA
jgi:hypothetical protein